MSKSYILASGSPRRKELLELLHIDFKIITSDIEEIINPDLSHEDVVMDLAKQKATDIASSNKGSIVLGFDTLVIYKNSPLGKPKDNNDAFSMLRQLSGNTHQVLTGCCIIEGDKVETFYDQALVTFSTMTDQEILDYIDTNEPMDKAGAYGIQGYGAKFIENVNGDFYSVMGLPINKLYKYLNNIK
ncbi:septum formation inhibitor Maf [Candidatus Izimaplasma bacterium ZiA1]|uniref:Maf family protein n=1 Tax=Candidatus Izimoplasma sp. ZiA1 TaxID=2024899 RepID=UPI000BAA6D6D|nr:septum formation inhibitor Maf [Candidatus Izimaplasma bacterium ZiA1]